MGEIRFFFHNFCEISQHLQTFWLNKKVNEPISFDIDVIFMVIEYFRVHMISYVSETEYRGSG